MRDNTTILSDETAAYFREPQPKFGQMLVWGSTLLSVAFIGVFGVLWKTISRKVNDWENHRTHGEYEDAYVAKQYVFQFINFYFMLVYIAYLKQGTILISYNMEHFGSDWQFQEGLKDDVLRLSDGNIPIVEMKETCIPNPSSAVKKPDCLYELFTQLMVLFLGKQFIMEAVEQVVPKLQRTHKKVLLSKNTPEVVVAPGPAAPEKWQPEAEAPVGKDLQVSQCFGEFTMPRFGDREIEGCIDDFNEMMIQFGFMTLFAVALPGGAFFALLNNIYEMRSDADALLSDFQRPPVSRRDDIGAWGGVLQLISYLAVVSNSFIIGFTSEASYELLVDSEAESSIDERCVWCSSVILAVHAAADGSHLSLIG